MDDHSTSTSSDELVGSNEERMMQPNPLDWTAGPFLLLYLSLVSVIVPFSSWLHISIGRSGVPTDLDRLGAVELAYLAGGRRRAADSVLVGFLTARVAKMSRSRAWIDVDPSLPGLSEDLERFRQSIPPTVNRAVFHSAIENELKGIGATLVRRGFVPSLAETASLQILTLMLFLIPILFGIAKIIIGSERNKPVGFLAILVVITICLWLWFLLRPLYRTRAGGIAIKLARRDHDRAVRAPRRAELPLAFALKGPLVLKGLSYAMIIPGAVPFLTSDWSGPGVGGSCSGGN